MRMTHPQDLSALPIRDPASGHVFAVIETPRGSRNKYGYDPELGVFKLNAVLPLGTVFPYDFGFIPSTKAEDGDALDVMLLLDEPTPVGTLVNVRIIGAIAAEQRERDGKWLRNDRLVAVASKAHLHSEIDNLQDLNPRLLEEIEAFFKQYNELSGKEFRVLERTGSEAALELIRAASQ